MTDDGRTHWIGCFRERGHHECAVAEVERLRGALNRYGQHHSTCVLIAAAVNEATHSTPQGCICGFERAMGREL